MRIKHPYIILLLLTVAYVLSFMDRYVMNLLLNKVKYDLHLTEVQAGLLAGAGFAILYALMTLPMGLIADRTNRVKLAAVGVALWSIATTLCGLSKNFIQLIFSRSIVGVGEAALTPAAYPLIKSLFSERRLATAIGIYSSGIYLGSGLAYWLGGMLMENYAIGVLTDSFSFVKFDWQIVFILFGLPGIIVALLLCFVTVEAEEIKQHSSYTFKDVLAFLKANDYYFLKFSIASALFNVAVYAAGVWLPVYLQRVHKMSIAESGEIMGMAMLLVAPVGAIAGGILGDKFGGGKRVTAILIAIVPVLLSFILLGWGSGITGFYMPLMLLCFTLGAPVAITAAAVQEIAPANMRSIAPAVLLTLQNLIGMSLGPLLVAFFTQNIFRDEMSIGASVAIVGCTFCFLSIAIFASTLKKQV